MNTRCIIIAALAGLALAGSAAAQTVTKTTRIVKKTHTVNDGGLQRGANSFTEAQARGHIHNAGFTHVSTLTKGAGGIWHGMARRSGRTVEVALDFKGNVTTGR